MTLTIQEIRKCLADLATIIETAPEGDKYWPLFDRMERELALAESRRARLHAARAAYQEGDT